MAAQTAKTAKSLRSELGKRFRCCTNRDILKSTLDRKQAEAKQAEPTRLRWRHLTESEKINRLNLRQNSRLNQIGRLRSGVPMAGNGSGQ